MVNECYEYMDIVATSALLARKSLNQFNKMANIEASKQISVTAAVNMTKGMLRQERNKQ